MRTIGEDNTIKNVLKTIFAALLLLALLSRANDIDNTTYQKAEKVNLIIGSKTYTATLNENAAVAKLKVMFPLALDMRDLNSNEKYFDFSVEFPTESEKPGVIYTGDLMLWNNNTLVLFYETFKTPYAYTRIGKLDNPVELAEILGSGNVTVTFK